ncbi:glycoside hydrolase family 43 protein [Clostridium sp. YIM B02555]|uniref:glycoside hydrolase family 43 protein n=1 Tax=Clostridium sp. YIM B02555 TaxID=2911968 RepID=UPI001EEE7483|nr:glycoside hydrolase family 43 protein [Clostridium sp. YIM B02555]
MTERKIKNPIISGFYPDPSICRVGEDYYLICSSFEMYPGIPIFHSKDLANWEQIGNALTKDNGFHVEFNSMVGGVMAPTIRYNNGTFYIINANFCDKGNFIITAKDPKGTWSEPHWLTDVPGIDASFFFDNDGKAYVMGTGDVWDNGAGVKERGIWLAPYDMENFKLAGEPVTIFNSALRGGSAPEAPHIYHIGDYYYLMIAEGGTEHYHAVMVARSKELFGWYEGCTANPVMTHRHFGFKAPIINVGHADFVETQNGEWYAVMLASRLIDGEYKNLGRETFICPVMWEREWPIFSPGTGKLEWEYTAASLPWTEFEKKEKDMEDFDEERDLGMTWVLLGTPYEPFYKIYDSKLSLKCLKENMTPVIKPLSFNPEICKDRIISFVGKRQIHIDFSLFTKMSFNPQEGESAGLAIMQAMHHHLRVERTCENGKQLLKLIISTTDYDRPPYFPGFSYEHKEEIIACVPCDDNELILGFNAKHESYDFVYGTDLENMKCLAENVDCGRINPEYVGCMAGTIIGMFATANGKESDNVAEFDWFQMKGAK